MGGVTVLTRATSKSKSLRTTIPMGLNWEIRAEGGELIIVVRPLKGERKDES